MRSRSLMTLLLAAVCALGLVILVNRSAPPGQPYDNSAASRTRLTIPFAGTGVLPHRLSTAPTPPGPIAGNVADVTAGGIASGAAAADVGTIPPGVGRITQDRPVPIQEMMKRAQGVMQLILTDRGIRPPRMRVKVGDRVKLHVVNRGGARHNLVIPDFSVYGHNMNPGEETYIEFNVDKVGSFPYYSDTGHINTPEPGLEGIIQVTQ